MKILGVTGGIGSGKTTVVKEFEKLGVPVFIADERSKKILAEDLGVIKQVKSLLGEKAYVILNGSQVPDRVYIASIVFADKQKLESLNAILHPAVAADFKNWKLQQKYAYCIYEAAILLETGGRNHVNNVLLVTAPLELRIDRVTKRDSSSREEVLKRINTQWTDQKRSEFSDFVIINTDISMIASYCKRINDIMLIN